MIVNGVGNNERFLNKLFTEAGNEFNIDVDKDTISFYDLNDSDSKKLSLSIAKAILSEFEKKVLVKIINKTCEGFNKSDKIEIWNIAMRQLLDDEYMNNSDYLLRLDAVNRSVAECMNTSDVLSVEGFVNFRLNEYAEELEDVVDLSVQEYMIELEYREFINMLKYFISMQTPKYLSVDIYYGKNIKIYADGKDVTDECMEEYFSDINCDIGNKDDYILNSLIVIAPRKVKFHLTDDMPDKELTDTLRGVFGGKIVFCSDVNQSDMS